MRRSITAAAAISIVAGLLTVGGSAAVAADPARPTTPGSPLIAGAAGTYVALTPARLLDTRHALGGTRPAGHASLAFTVLGHGSVPASGVSAVVLTVTVPTPAGSGYVTAYADGTTRPATSNVNFTHPLTAANLVIAPVGADGKVRLYNGSTRPTNLVADVSGYVRSTAGTIRGVVTSAVTGGGLGGVYVTVFDRDEDPIESTSTSSSGSYALGGLTAGAAAYFVCFGAAPATGGGSTTGYLSQCNGHTPWDGDVFEIPGGAPVSVGVAGTVTASIALPVGAAVSGRVTAAAGGAPLAGVGISVFGPDTGYAPNGFPTTTTAADGTYRLTRLPPSSDGYVVCFNGLSATGGPSHVGYLDQCYDNVAWDSFSQPPAATTLPLSAGETRTAVDDALPASATISGVVTAAAGGAALTSVYVYAYDAAGDAVNFVLTDDRGRYAVPALPAAAGPYRVCFDASAATGGPAPSYPSACYQNVPWGGVGTTVPSATPVSVTAGAATTGIDAGL